MSTSQDSTSNNATNNNNNNNMTPEQRKEREHCFFLARLAEQCDRFEDMVEYMKALTKLGGPDLTVDERNNLSVAYKNVVGARRANWRLITTNMQDDERKDAGAHMEYYKELRDKVEAELQAICQDVMDLLETHLIPRATTGDSKVFYLKMKGDYLRYMAECTEGDARKPIADKANAVYQEATKIANEQLTPTHPTRLGLALNYSVFFYEILGLSKEACKLARGAWDSALAEIDVLPEESYRDSSVIMQLLHQNVDQWEADEASKMASAEVAAAPTTLPGGTFIPPPLAATTINSKTGV